MRVLLPFTLAGLIGISASAHAQVARQEVHSFQSVTLSDPKFLGAWLVTSPIQDERMMSGTFLTILGPITR